MYRYIIKYYMHQIPFCLGNPWNVLKENRNTKRSEDAVNNGIYHDIEEVDEGVSNIIKQHRIITKGGKRYIFIINVLNNHNLLFLDVSHICY